MRSARPMVLHGPVGVRPTPCAGARPCSGALRLEPIGPHRAEQDRSACGRSASHRKRRAFGVIAARDRWVWNRRCARNDARRPAARRPRRRSLRAEPWPAERRFSRDGRLLKDCMSLLFQPITELLAAFEQPGEREPSMEMRSCGRRAAGHAALGDVDGEVDAVWPRIPGVPRACRAPPQQPFFKSDSATMAAISALITRAGRSERAHGAVRARSRSQLRRSPGSARPALRKRQLEPLIGLRLRVSSR